MFKTTYDKTKASCFVHGTSQDLNAVCDECRQELGGARGTYYYPELDPEDVEHVVTVEHSAAFGDETRYPSWNGRTLPVGNAA